MELRQLRYFVRIIETGSMGSAAQDLDIGVSALSQQMSRLENELAIRLLQRTSRGVTPTNAGLAFYSQAQLACVMPTTQFSPPEKRAFPVM
ncbi:LysR family transcriptional regulator [Salmonella enterica subsp. enterica]|nr:LysR family transcriptional regulator [Salmonella enterica subsp. enterica]